MIYHFLLFTILAFSMLAAANLPVYFAFRNFFPIEEDMARSILLIFLLSSSFSFILSSILIHKFDNKLTRFFYRVSSFWMGVLIYLFLFSILALLIFDLTVFLDLEINMLLFAFGIIFFSLVLSVYSYLNTKRLRIKKIKVSIKNLPDAWVGKTIAHLSDIHLGAILGFDHMKNIGEKVNSLKPNLVLITGDLFDGAGDDIDKSLKPVDKIKSEYGIYYITGNHENYLGLGKALSAIKKTKIKHLGNKAVDLGGLELIGLDYPFSEKITEEEKLFPAKKKKRPKIVMTHEPVGIKFFQKKGVNLQLSGHTHHGQIFPFNIFTRIIYRGYDYGLSKKGDYNIYTSCGTGTWGPTMRNFSRSEIVAIELEKS